MVIIRCGALVAWLPGLVNVLSLVGACGSITMIDHVVKSVAYFPSTVRACDCEQKENPFVSFGYRVFLAFGASTIISAQEITRALCVLKRFTLFSFARRMDWFDGQAALEVLDQKLRSGLQFILYCCAAYYFLLHEKTASPAQCPSS